MKNRKPVSFPEVLPTLKNQYILLLAIKNRGIFNKYHKKYKKHSKK